MHREDVSRYVICGALILAAPLGAFALRVEFSLDPRVVELGETATARVTIYDADRAQNPELPAVSGLDFQPAGTEQNFSIGPNGRESSLTYTFRALPSRTGKFVIGPWSYRAGGEDVQVPAVTLEVVAPRQSSSPGGSSSAGEQLQDFLFARLLSERQSVYTQERFDLIIALYFRDLNLDRDIGLVDLKTTGLKLGPFSELRGDREVIDGRVYEVRRFRATATALTAGQFSLQPTLRVGLVVPRQSRRDPFFSDFPDPFGMFSRHETRAVDVSARPLQITVRSPPEQGRPNDFAGAVGHFTFDVSANPSELHAGDPLTLQTRIAGRGNFESLTAPPLRLDDRFRVYDAKVVNRQVDEDTGSGQLVFEQVVIPRDEKIKELPELSFSFFDPIAERYETIRRGPFALSVKPGSSDQMRVVQNQDGAPQAPAPVLGTDIVYLKPAPRRWRAWPPPLRPGRSFGTVVNGFAPPLLFAIAWLWVRRKEELARDISKARRQAAPKVAREALRRAESAARTGEARVFADSLWEALASYFGHRFNLAPGEIGRDVVIPRLIRGGLPPEHVENLDAIFSQCEQARFGAGHGPFDPNAARAQVRTVTSLLHTCERLRL